MSLKEKIPDELLIVKDLGMLKEHIPGNPYSRYDPDNGQRKYCSQSLWDNADEKFVIPEGANDPRPHVECEECGHDSYRTDDDECGRCGCPLFDCPACGEEVCGQPSECPACGAAYKWS